MKPHNYCPTPPHRIPRSRPIERRLSIALAFLSVLLVIHPNVLPAQDAESFEKSLIEDLQAALFEEEVNQDLDAAIEGYSSLVDRIDQQRALAATALYRLGECYRKQGDNDQAATIYERVLTDFSDQEKAVAVSAQNLRAINPQSPALATENPNPNGLPPSPTNGLPQDPDTLKRLLESYLEELAIIEDDIAKVSKLIANGTQPLGSLNKPRRDRLEIMRQIALVEGALKSANPNPQSSLTTEEAEALKLAKRIVQESPDLLQATDTANPIYEPALAGHSTVVEYLLEQGAFPNPNELIARVAFRGNLALTKSLVTKLPQTDDVPAILAKALLGPIANGYVALVEHLLDSGANPDALIYTQTLSNNEEMLEMLPTHPRYRSVTPLMLAAHYVEPRIIELLLNAGADVNFQNNSLNDPRFRTALHAGVNNPEILQILLENGADPNLPFENSTGILNHSLLSNSSSSAPALTLLEYGANVEGTATDQYTPLYYSITTERIEIANKLIEMNADCTVRPEGRSLLLHLIEESGQNPSGQHVALARKLIRNGVEINASQDDSWSALLQAAWLGSPTWIQLLLESGADPNLRDSEGVSAITTAANAQERSSTARGPVVFGRNGSTGRPGIPRSDSSAECIRLLRNAGAILEPKEKAELLLESNEADNPSQAVFKEILLTPPLDIPATDRELSIDLLKRATSPKMLRNLEALCKADANINIPISTHQTPLEKANWLINDLNEHNEFQEAQRWEAVAAILLEHGADPNYTRKQSIQLKRDDETIVYAQKTFDGQTHSLIDILADACDPSGCPANEFRSPDQNQGNRVFQTPFPDLRRILIHSIGPDSEMTTETVDVVAALNRGTDIRAQWGDIIEIPELPHPVGEFWPGLPRELQNVLIEKTARTFTLKRHGETFPVRAETRMQTSEKDGLVIKSFFYQLEDDSTSFASLTEEQRLELHRYQIILSQAREAVEETIRKHNDALESEMLTRYKEEHPIVQEFRIKIASMTEISKELQSAQMRLEEFVMEGAKALQNINAQFDYKETQTYRALIELLDTRVELAGYRAKYGEKHPTIVEGTVLFESNKKDLRELLAKNTGTRTFIDFVDGPNSRQANQINVVVNDPHDFTLKSLLVEGQLLLSNSDTANIKVTRPQSDDDEPQTWETNLDGVIAANLVIQEGDIVEIRER